MRFCYLTDDLEGDPLSGRIYALPMDEPDGEAFELDLRDGTASPGWTPWFVETPISGRSLPEAEVHRLVGAVGLPPGAEAA